MQKSTTGQRLLRLAASLPTPAYCALADLAYPIVYYLLRYRRGVVRDNLDHAFPTLASGRREEIARASYRHFTSLILEILRSIAMPRAEFARRVRFSNLDLLRDATEDFTRQGIILLAHQGNWEWALHAVMAQVPVPVDPVYKPLHSDFWNALMLRARSRFGARPIALGAVGRDVIRRRREPRLIAMVADQTGPMDGYWTDFLHRPASFHRGAGKLPLTLQVPVIFAACRCIRRGHYEITFHELARPPHAADSDTLIDAYVRCAEAAVEAQPETYLWTNRRWKKQRQDT